MIMRIRFLHLLQYTYLPTSPSHYIAIMEQALESLFAALQLIDPTNYLPSEQPTTAASAHAPAPVPAPAPPVQPQTCPVCLEPPAQDELAVPGPCTHTYCLPCLSRLCRHSAGIRQVVPCGACGAVHDLAPLLQLPLPLFERHREALADAYAEHAAGPLAYCAQCHTPVSGVGMSADRDSRRWRCPACDFENRAERIDNQQDESLPLPADCVRCRTCATLVSKHDSWSCNHARCACGVELCLRCGAPYNSADAGAGSASTGRANQYGTPSCSCGLYQRE